MPVFERVFVRVMPLCCFLFVVVVFAHFFAESARGIAKKKKKETAKREKERNVSYTEINYDRTLTMRRQTNGQNETNINNGRGIIVFAPHEIGL